MGIIILTRGLDATMRDSFTQQVAGPYKALAELLIQRGRIAEAERVFSHGGGD